MRLFFHVHERGQFIPDPEGLEFPSIERARELALKSAREIARILIMEGEPIDDWSLEVRDSIGTLVFTIVPGDVISPSDERTN